MDWKLMHLYEKFSEVYNSLFDDSLYDEWLRYTLEQVSREDSAIRWLDLACGDGKLAIRAKQAGLVIEGMDLSADMIQRARQKAADHALEIPFAVGDMRAFDYPKSAFNLVTLFCDSLLYLHEEEDIYKVFENVYELLPDSGQFLFDIISPDYINHTYPGYSYVYEWDDTVFTWTSEQYRGENTIDHTLNMFFEDESGGKYLRYEEIHEQTVLPVSRYIQLLEQIGFETIEVHADFSDEAPDEQTKRIFFSCRKG